MKSIRYVTFLLFVTAAGFVEGQQIKRFATTENKSTPEENLSLANELYNKGEFFSAARLYEKVLSEQADNGLALYQLANAERLLRNYDEAETLYQKVISENSSAYPEARYWYGITLESQGRYDDALRQFKTASEGKGVTANMIKNKIASSEFALSTRSADDKIQIALVNYDKHAFGAYPTDDNELLFTSVEEKLIKHKVEHGEITGIYDTIYNNAIFQGSLIGNSINNPTPVKLQYGDDVLSGGSASLSPDKSRIYFSVCQSLEGNTNCNLYMSNKKKDDWSNPVKITDLINMPGYSSKHPMVVTEGNETILFYSSNRPGGSGGYDLWYAKISSDDKFGSPVNLGTPVNTSGDEVTPYYQTSSSTLFFSSNGHAGLGQLDVYLVQLNKTNQQGSLVHLGKPINSSADDYYFNLAASGLTGYLSSNRGANYDKIYTVKFKEAFSYKRLDDTMAEIKTLEEGDSDFALFKESFAYRALAADEESSAPLASDDITLSGTLFSGGETASNKTVMLVDGQGNIIDTTTADENGFFEFKKLPADQNYSLMFQEKDAPLNFTADYRNTAGEILKTVKSEEDPSLFQYRKLADNQSTITALDAGDGVMTFPEGNPESLFTPAMTYDAYDAVESNFYDRLKDQVILRVQVGAYRHPSPGLFKDLKLDYPVERVKVEGLTKFLSGNFTKLKEAEVQRKSAYDQGVLDAFIAVYLNGKRIAILMY